MGDNQSVVYYSWLEIAHVSLAVIRILLYVLFETLDNHYKKLLLFFLLISANTATSIQIFNCSKCLEEWFCSLGRNIPVRDRICTLLPVPSWVLRVFVEHRSVWDPQPGKVSHLVSKIKIEELKGVPRKRRKTTGKVQNLTFFPVTFSSKSDNYSKVYN